MARLQTGCRTGRGNAAVTALLHTTKIRPTPRDRIPRGTICLSAESFELSIYTTGALLLWLREKHCLKRLSLGCLSAIAELMP